MLSGSDPAKYSSRWLRDDSSPSQTPIARSIVQRLQRFGTYGRLKQVALRKVAHTFAADSQLLTELRQLFDAIDSDGSGTISHDEMIEATRFGIPLPLHPSK